MSSPFRTRRWTREEYDRLIELDVLHEDDPIELVEGRMIVAEPQNDPHARAVELAGDALRAAFGAGWRIRVQLPMALGQDSEPEPDIVIIRGTPFDAPPGHPTVASLVVEVADSSLRLDRGLKARVYARAGIPECWIVNLAERVVEIYREPVSDSPRRAAYRSASIARPGETLAPLAAPDARIPVDALLPPVW